MLLYPIIPSCALDLSRPGQGDFFLCICVSRSAMGDESGKLGGGGELIIFESDVIFILNCIQMPGHNFSI